MKLCSPRPEEQVEKPPFRLRDYQIKAVVLAICEAWRRVCTKSFSVLDDEEATTDELCEELDRVQSEEVVPVFTYDYFETPSCDERFKAVCAGKKYRRLDMIIRPAGKFKGGGKRYYGLFFEYKLLKFSGPGINQYVRDGIYRFLYGGDYAPQMNHAMMLAYAEPRYTLPDHLNDFFQKSSAKSASECKPTGACRQAGYCESPKIYITVHPRHFRYDDGRKPGEIEIHHLWLHPL